MNFNRALLATLTLLACASSSCKTAPKDAAVAEAYALGVADTVAGSRDAVYEAHAASYQAGYDAALKEAAHPVGLMQYDAGTAAALAEHKARAEAAGLAEFCEEYASEAYTIAYLEALEALTEEDTADESADDRDGIYIGQPDDSGYTDRVASLREDLCAIRMRDPDYICGKRATLRVVQSFEWKLSDQRQMRDFRSNFDSDPSAFPQLVLTHDGWFRSTLPDRFACPDPEHLKTYLAGLQEILDRMSEPGLEARNRQVKAHE